MSDGGRKVEVPETLLRQLSGAAAQMGLSLPDTRFAPTVDVMVPMRQLALELGHLVSRQNIFLMGNELVTLDAQTGEQQPMTAARFVGWVEEFCALRRGGRNTGARDSLTRDEASLVLQQDIFRSCLRPLEAVHAMRLPVRRGNGDIEFLEPGYDAPSRIFTAQVLEYEMDWPLDRATKFLDEHGADYPWAWPDEKRPSIDQNRNWCVQLSAMLGVYCRAMFAVGTTRPMIVYIGNQPGTGKSTLVAMALLPVYGHASTTKTPKDDGEMDKELETIARTYQPYAFFDDIGGGIFSNPLNRFITSTSHAGRVMGGNKEVFRAPALTQVFATGNDIKVSLDLMRRSLVVELFLPGEVKGRRFPRTISAMYLAAVETRQQFLAAQCALVRNYMATRAAMVAAGREVPTVRGLESFEDFTSTISAMVQCAGYNDPLQAPDLSGAGTEDEDEMRELLVKLASEAHTSCVFDRKTIMDRARDWGLLESVVGVPGDKEVDSASTKKFGRQLQKWRGRVMRDFAGRRFQFSHRRQKKGATYPLTFLRPGSDEPVSPP